MKDLKSCIYPLFATKTEKVELQKALSNVNFNKKTELKKPENAIYPSELLNAIYFLKVATFANKQNKISAYNCLNACKAFKNDKKIYAFNLKQLNYLILNCGEKNTILI